MQNFPHLLLVITSLVAATKVLHAQQDPMYSQVKDELQIGYAYDMTMSKFSGTNSGSHELMLRYEPFAKEAKKKQAQVSRKKASFNKPNKRQSHKKRSSKYRKPKRR